MSSTVIGGNFKCYHGIDTDSVDEWNAHCSDPANEHTESGFTKCIDCQRTIEFNGIPYHPITPTGKNIQLRCPECFEGYTQTFRNSQNMVRIMNPEEEKVQNNTSGLWINQGQKNQSTEEEKPQQGKVTARGKLL